MFNFVKQQTENQYAGTTQITVSCLFHTPTIQTKTRKNKPYPMESKEKNQLQVAKK
jgi:hypothetical protein